MAGQQSPPHDSNPDLDADDRRRAERHFVCVPARVQPVDGGNQKLALIENISVTGAALLTRSEPAIGEIMTLALYFSGTGAEPRWAKARVVRSVPVGEGGTIWKCRVAVAFDEHLDDCTEEIRVLAEAEEA